MRKFLAIVKREYVQRVRARMFIVSTILLPLVMLLFAIVPAIILNIKTPPMRVAVVDQTGKMYRPLKESLNSDDPNEEGNDDATQQTGRRFGRFILQEVNATGQSLEQLRANLNEHLRTRELEGYLILP